MTDWFVALEVPKAVQASLLKRSLFGEIASGVRATRKHRDRR